MPESVDSPGRPNPVPWDSVLPQDLAKLDRLSPELRNWCLSMLDKQETHRRHLRWADRFLYGFGALLGGGSVGAYVWVAVYFVSHHAPTQGAAILGGGAATLAGTFLGVRARKRDRTGDLLPSRASTGTSCKFREVGVDRTAFYGSRPYAHLRAEFEQRLEELRHAGERPDPRDAQVNRLKDEIARLKERVTQSDATISELVGFRGQALARLAAQHDEITRLRQEVRLAAGVRRLPAPAPSAKEQNLS